MQARATTVLTLIVVAAAFPLGATADQFEFGNEQNGLTGFSTATILGTEFELQMASGPAAAIFNESDEQGLGIDSRAAAGSDDEITKFNLIGGTGPLAGQGESMSFSFDQAGIITGLNFDGVKDETLEYFVLDSPGLTPTYFFDSQADPTQIHVSGNVIFLLEDDFFDDEIVGLAIPFAANQEITLAYGQLLNGNGSRFEGLTVEVPEPTGVLPLAPVAIAFLGRRAKRFGRPRRSASGGLSSSLIYRQQA